MTTVKEKSQGKSGFLKEFFVDQPNAGKVVPVDGGELLDLPGREQGRGT